MDKKDIYAVILAGGSGTRFWPLSRASQPKQFIKIIGAKTLFQETIERIKPLVHSKNIFVVTNKKYKQKIKELTRGKGILSSHILLEPQVRNTAPAICWAAACIKRINPQAVMIVLPSDHLILNKKVFSKSVKDAVKMAKKGFLVTLGIVPTRPETGYGYLKTAKKKLAGNIFKLEKFVEKPNLKKAKGFLRTKRYFWNSGMFIWQVRTILDEFKRLQPKIYSSLIKEKNVAKGWKKLPSLSVDYGILEKAKEIVSVSYPNMQWSDLGSWESLGQFLPKDKRGNVLKGDVISLDTKKTCVFSGKRLIATVGLEGLIIVDTPDALLVCRAQDSQKVKDVVALLKKRKRKEV